jgi:hypothetical protein
MEDNPWTEARVAELRCLVAGQVPYTQIARQLGVSRNAAIGKASRLKICAPVEAGSVRTNAGQRSALALIRPAGSWRSQAGDLLVRPLPTFQCEPVPPSVSSDPLNLSIEQLKFFHCRYITNDDLRQPTYCARDTVEGTSWCAFHLARVRAPLPADEIPLVPGMAPVKSRV